MNKKQRQLYEAGIKDIAESLLIDAHKKAFDITENVFVDILVVLRQRIDEIIARREDRQ